MFHRDDSNLRISEASFPYGFPNNTKNKVPKPSGDWWWYIVHNTYIFMYIYTYVYLYMYIYIYPIWPLTGDDKKHTKTPSRPNSPKIRILIWSVLYTPCSRFSSWLFLNNSSRACLLGTSFLSGPKRVPCGNSHGTTKTNKKLITQNESTICSMLISPIMSYWTSGCSFLSEPCTFTITETSNVASRRWRFTFFHIKRSVGLLKNTSSSTACWWKTWRNDADHGGYIRMDLRGSDTCFWSCLIIFYQSWLVGIQACWIHIVDMPQGGWSAMQLDVFVSLEAQTTCGIPTVKTFISCMQPKWHGVCII